MRSSILLALLFTVMLISASFATDTQFQSLTDAICTIKEQATSILGPIAFLLVVMAAVIYGGGQLGDAQMRAKAQGWAVGALVGAIVAFVLYTVGPWFVTQLYGDVCNS